MGKKGKKKSKAEIEAERIEAERVAEEERVAAEKAEAARLERERVATEKLKEQQKEEREEELARLTNELKDAEGNWERRRSNIDALREEAEVDRNWTHFRNCVQVPTGDDALAVNGYLARLEIDASEERIRQDFHGRFTLEHSLQTIAEAEGVARGVEGARADALARGDLTSAAACDVQLHNLRDAVVQRLNRCTADVLQHNEDYAVKDDDESKKEMLACATDASSFATRVGVWATLKQAMQRGPFKQLSFGDGVGVHVDLPKSLGTQRGCVRAVVLGAAHVGPTRRTSALTLAQLRSGMHAPEGDDGSLLAGRDMLALGGAVQVEILGLPPPARRLRAGWFLQPVTGLSTSVQVKAFPDYEEDKPFKFEGKGPEPNKFVRVRVALPPSVVAPEAEGAVRVLWWDPACDKWVDGTACEISLKGREVSWTSTRTGVLSIAQPRTLDLPYVSWSLAPALPADQSGPSEVEEACAVLSLETPRFTVQIEARGDGSCRLVAPDRPELQPLMTASTTAGRLIAELSKCGVHLAPDALDAEALVKRGGGFVAKHADIEGKLCEEMAALAAGFDVAGDPAAKGLGADRCAVRLRETAAYVGTGETTMDYDTLLVERDECSRSCQNAPGATVFVEGRAKGEEYVGSLPAPAVKCQLVWGGSATGTPETDRPFDESAASGATSHVYLARAVRPVASDEAFDRVAAAPLKFQQAVEELLHLTRPFSFC